MVNYKGFRLPRQYTIAVLAIFALIVFAPIAQATSYNYDLTATVGGNGGELGTITGSFTIDTDGVPYNTAGGYTGHVPLLTASSLFWNPIGGAPTPYDLLSEIALSLGGDSSNSQAETCTFAPNTECQFLLLGGTTIGPDGAIDLSGYLGQQLNIDDEDFASLLTVYGPNGAEISSDQATFISGTAVATPEPSTLSLVIVGAVLSVLSLFLKRRSHVSNSV